MDNNENKELEALEKAEDMKVKAEDKAEGKKEKKKENKFVEWAKTILIPIIIAILILQVIRPTLVQQHSMLPTVEPNDYLIVYKLAYKFGEPEDKDIIVFQSELKDADNNDKYLIKRIIAVGGQTIEIKDGEVYVDGVQQDEPYINGDYTPGDVELTTVPEGYLFVMGDNRGNSTDSRDSRVGFVSEDQVMGKVVVRLFPFSKIGSPYK